MRGIFALAVSGAAGFVVDSWDLPDHMLGNPTQCYDEPGGAGRVGRGAAEIENRSKIITGTLADCGPGYEYCDVPFEGAPQYHLMDQQGCGENDPNGPVFDPVHGVFHHFYQIHLASPQGGDGGGPDYGHFVSKNLVEWTFLPVAIWNGVDKTTGETPYDTRAIFTGSATLVPGAAPDGESLGVVQIYPGLCTEDKWPGCTGTLLAMAMPSDYAGDELLVNWTKTGVIVNDTERDPSTAWKTASGEWRLRTYDSMVYGAASDEDLLAGEWYTIGGDWWQLGNYVDGPPKVLGNFTAAEGWEAEFEQLEIDVGQFYASKDTDYPALDGSHRRINYGWATVPPQSAQTLPREVTFNADARLLQQYPVEEVAELRLETVFDDSITVDGSYDLDTPDNVTRQSELLVVFDLPDSSATLGVTVGDLICTVAYDASRDGDYADHDVSCGSDPSDDFTVRLLASETTLEIRLFADWTFAEVYFQRGRAAVTETSDFVGASAISLQASAPATATVSLYPMKSIWVDEATVRKTDRVYAWSD